MPRKLSLGAAALACLVFLAASGLASTLQGHDNAIVRLLEAGEVAFGSFVREKTAAEARGMASDPRLDFVFYDMERGEFDVETLGTFLAALRESDDPPAVLVRIAPIHADPDAARERVRAVVEVGADGITFPHVLDPEEARQGVAWVEEATDGLWPGNPGGDFLAFVMVEDPSSVAIAGEIVGTEGVSIASPGPGSLRQAYEGDMEKVEAAVEAVLAACKTHGVPCANTASETDVVSKVERGFRLLITQGEALELGREAAAR